MLTYTGVQFLVWIEHPVSVGICVQVGVLYIGFQMVRILQAISHVPKSVGDVETGIITGGIATRV